MTRWSLRSLPIQSILWFHGPHAATTEISRVLLPSIKSSGSSGNPASPGLFHCLKKYNYVNKNGIFWQDLFVTVWILTAATELCHKHVLPPQVCGFELYFSRMKTNKQTTQKYIHRRKDCGNGNCLASTGFVEMERSRAVPSAHLMNTMSFPKDLISSFSTSGSVILPAEIHWKAQDSLCPGPL